MYGVEKTLTSSRAQGAHLAAYTAYVPCCVLHAKQSQSRYYIQPRADFSKMNFFGASQQQLHVWADKKQASGRGKESATQQQQEMTDCDGPLDFEFEDELLTPTISVPKKRKKVIGLDDLLTDFYKEKNKCVERETTQKCYNSDEDDDNSRGNKEALLSKFVDDCQKQVHEISTEEEFFAWGQQIFGQQKSPPPFAFPGVRSITLLQSFTNNELNSMTELVSERGETFLEGLLLNGWLSKLVIKCGHVEDSIVSWTLYLMFYSSNEDLQDSACHFWLSILASKNEVNVPSIRLGHFPSYTDLKDALETYGYLSESSINVSSLSKMCHTDSGSEGPPQNLRSWLKYLAACCQLRSIQTIFSTSEVEEFLGVIIRFFLDRRLQGLLSLFHECMQSIISFFTDDEWIASSEKVATSLAHRIPKDFNSLKVVKCIFGVDTRTKHLRSELAFQILVNCFDEKVTEGEEVLRLLMAINVKDKSCDFHKVYMYLALAETWLFSSPLLEQRPVVHEMWTVYLRNCSCQITSTDWRSYASKVRNKASYLLQSTMQRRNCD